jgi:hypothetical protein
MPVGCNPGSLEFWRFDARRQGYGIMRGITTSGTLHDTGQVATTIIVAQISANRNGRMIVVAYARREAGTEAVG